MLVQLLPPLVPLEPRCTALLIPRALSDVQQSELYQELCSTVRGGAQWHKLLADIESGPLDPRPQPLCVYNHPHSGQTNAAHPPRLAFSFAQQLAARASNDPNVDAAVRDELSNLSFDSLVSLVYAPSGALPEHVDRGLPGLGLSISLGASCSFEYGGTVRTLRSGDALLGAFGDVPHQVLRVHDESSAPDWWHRLSDRASEATTFGRVRCSLQLRDARALRATQRRAARRDVQKIR